MDLFKTENIDHFFSSNRCLLEKIIIKKKERRVNLCWGIVMVINSFQYYAFLPYFFSISPSFGLQINFTFLKQASPDIFSVLSY